MATLTDRAWRDLVMMVSRRYPTAEEGQVAESIEDALLAYRDHPERFDCGLGVPLICYLAMTAGGYLSHRLRGEMRRRRRERTGFPWGEAFEKKTRSRVTGGVERAIPIGEDESELQRRELERRLTLLKPCELALVGLWLCGITALEAWAEAMGIGHLPREEKDCRVRAKKMSLKRKLKNPPGERPGGMSP